MRTLSCAEANERDAIRRVREVDPAYKPSASLTMPDSVEGQIARAEANAREAQARYGEIVGRLPTHDILAPGGSLIGRREGRARSFVKTVTTSEFTQLKSALKSGAQAAPSRSYYPGKLYKRLDGTIFGLRNSETFGETIDIIESNHSILRPGFKVHQK